MKRILISCLAVLAHAASASATAIWTPVVSNSNPVPTVGTANDLLLGGGVTHVNMDKNGTVIADNNTLFTYADGGNQSAGVSTLTDGAFGGQGTPPPADFAGIKGEAGGNDTITYSLDLSASPQGYNISSVGVYVGWNDNGRTQIQATVLYSTVAAPTVFLTLGTENFNSTGSPLYIVDTLANNSGPLLANNVAAIQFSFPSQQNSGVGYRELTVIGQAVPEPASLVLFCLGGLGLFAAAGRHRFTGSASA